jgi:mannobiose 2-epimerase
MQRRSTWSVCAERVAACPRQAAGTVLVGLLTCAACSASGEPGRESGLPGTGGTGATSANAGAAGTGLSASDPNQPAAAGTGPNSEGAAGAPALLEPAITGDAGSGVGDAGTPGASPDAGAGGSYGTGPDAGGPAAPLDPALVERLSALSARLSQLGTRTANFWLQHGPDATLGGFYGTLDRQGSPIAPDDKGLIQETRHLWTLSTWYERRQTTPAVRAQAAQQYAFVKDSFLDAADGAFVYKVSRDGSRIVDAKKQMFAESYAIYALCTYGRVFGDAEATGLALNRFASIDATRHDAVNGGYDQRNDPGTLSAGAEKDTNTHLHLMEAWSALYEATQNAQVGARLNELLDLFATKLRQPSGYVHSEFKLNWALVGTPRVSYGHDLETSWLMLDAARVLGRSNDVDVRAAALSIAARSAVAGFDAQAGGYFEAGPLTGVDDRDKIWWVQFEALEGLWWANELDPENVYLDRLGSTLDWIEQAEDLPAGEWFATTNADGSASGADYKGDEWKDSYHPVRSLVFMQDWIDAKLAGH